MVIKKDFLIIGMVRMTNWTELAKLSARFIFKCLFFFFYIKPMPKAKSTLPLPMSEVNIFSVQNNQLTKIQRDLEKE